MERKAQRRRRRCRVVYISIWGIMLLLHAAAWSSRGFCDWYLACVYGIWVDTYGRVMGMVPFSVGEILIGLGVCFVAVGVLLGAAWLMGRAAQRWQSRAHLKQADGSGQKKAAGGIPREVQESQAAGAGEAKVPYPAGSVSWERLGRMYCRAAMWILLVVFVLMTLNCYILYHASGFAGNYLETAAAEYSLNELETLRNFVVEQCNALCCQLPRREDGSLFYQGDMAEEAKEAMMRLGRTYSALDGFYPNPKPLRSSDFMSQQYVAGCFYPFSMEANYNTVMYEMNMPSTLCHELAHLKGFIREDEANLIGYLACVQSEDVYFRYSGYLSVLYYVDRDFRQAAGYERYLAGTAILPQVHADNAFLTEGERARIEADALLDTEVVDAVSDQVADIRLRLNGVEDGMASYSRVVELLLRYYDVNGYGGNMQK